MIVDFLLHILMDHLMFPETLHWQETFWLMEVHICSKYIKKRLVFFLYYLVLFLHFNGENFNLMFLNFCWYRCYCIGVIPGIIQSSTCNHARHLPATNVDSAAHYLTTQAVRKGPHLENTGIYHALRLHSQGLGWRVNQEMFLYLKVAPSTGKM